MRTRSSDQLRASIEKHRARLIACEADEPKTLRDPPAPPENRARFDRAAKAWRLALALLDTTKAWERAEKRNDFVRWAEPAPDPRKCVTRYAVTRESQYTGYRWRLFNPAGLDMAQSGGCFYSNLDGDGIDGADRAVRGARADRAKTEAVCAKYGITKHGGKS